MKDFDKQQKKVIRFSGGHGLVLAAPGCGKTEILSQRILKAHEDYHVSYDDMLCVTFTNRASRDMRERVQKVVGDNVGGLFVGNLHRLCINFLYENEIIGLNVGIIDDTDQAEIIAELANRPEVPQYFIKGVLDFAGKAFEEENNFPEEVRRTISPKTMGWEWQYSPLAKTYTDYKKENQVIDFDDIILLAYKAMMNPDFKKEYSQFSNYKWIQVDEVQDLTPLQLAIIEKLKAPEDYTLLYLGDERQAIYAFLGAGHNSIVNIGKACGGNVFNLSNNYRSPMYLLDMLNDYATTVLKIDVDKLPTTTNKDHVDDALQLIKCYDDTEQAHVMAMLARTIFLKETKESIGLLVRQNKDAEEISDILTEHKIKHLTITNKDIFKTVHFKCLYSHFSVVTNDTRYSDWARLLYQTRVIQKISDARRCITKMRNICVSPTDLIKYENSTYTIEYTKSFGAKEMVVFDTETTGLDIFNDDIIQIAAIKIRNGEIVPGSELDIIISTNKVIPPMLKKGLVNPMVVEYESRKNGIRRNPYEKFMEPQEAFEYFLNYIGNLELIGHNVNYDVHILENNIIRRTSGLSFSMPVFWDTLKLSRMLDPTIRKHTLEGLLQFYGLEGTNSHNAMDDILATKSLASYCYNRLLEKVDEQKVFIEHKVMKDIQRRMMKNYYPLYLHTFNKLYSREISEENTFIFEFQYIYDRMRESNYIEEIKRFNYMKALFDKVVINQDEDIYFNQQLVNHIYEFRTFNEADLYQNGIINERLHIMTIHKAKGLEFDNVFIYNITNGVFPHYKSTDTLEDAKVLYVAMSRARKRVWITYRNAISSFLQDDKVLHHFEDMNEGKLQRLMKFEQSFVRNDEDEEE
ncbi:MAG: 3'-5' exonuclease [Prevotella sp.]|nr:3'-5' exonuclease [Prevotella sp.]